MKIIYALTYCGTRGITVIIIKQLLLTDFEFSRKSFLFPSQTYLGSSKRLKTYFHKQTSFSVGCHCDYSIEFFSALYSPGGLSLAHQVLLFPLRTPRSISCTVETIGYTILRKVIFPPLWGHIL